MNDKQFIGGSCPIDVSYWDVNEQNKDGRKVRLVDFHPRKSMVVYADSNGLVTVCDYFTKSIKWAKLVTELVSSVGSPNRSYTKNTQKGERIFAKERLSVRCNSRLSGKAHIAPPVDNRNWRSVAKDHPVTAKAKSGNADIKQVSFVESSLTPLMSRSFHSDSNLLLIVRDHQVLLVDYVTHACSVVDEADLGRPPASADMLSPRCCAIGCSDGLIRLWDIGTRVVVRILAGHTRGAVNLLRTIPLDRRCADGRLFFFLAVLS